MAKKKKNTNANTEAPTTSKAPSTSEPADAETAAATAPDGERPPSQHHHHDHEHHHHHHSHYARSVDSEGNVKETKTEIVEIKEVKEIPADEVVVAESEKASIAPPKSKAASQSQSQSQVQSQSQQPSHVSVHTIKKTKSIAPPSAPPAQSTKAPTVKPPTIAPSVKPPSTKAPSVKAPPPGSPTPSHKSSKSAKSSHHQPEVIVNVTIPQPPPAAPPIIVQPPPPPTPSPAPPAPAEIVEEEVIDIQEKSVRGTPLVVPTEIPPTPKAPTVIAPTPKAPSIRSLAPPKSVKSKAPTVVEEPEEEVVEETKVVTTTTTTTTKKRPPSPPKTPQVISTDSHFVENIEPPPPPPSVTKSKSGKSSKPPPSAPPPALTIAPSAKSKRKSLPPPSVPVTPITPTPMKLPTLFKGSSGGGKKPMKVIETTTVEKIIVPLDSDGEEEVIVEEKDVIEEVDTAATTVGGATTKGIGGARSAALTATPGRRSGTKGGIRPIPMVDYQALIQSTPPPSIKKSFPSLPPATMTSSPSPQGPKTIVTYSAQLDRDSQGNGHLHARLRDHTGVVKDVDPTMPPASVIGSHPLPPTTYAQTSYTPATAPAPTIVPPAQGAKTIVTYSAQLDRDSQGNEHLHARLRDHTGAVKGLELDTGEGGGAGGLAVVETEKERKKREKKEKKEAEKLAKEEAKANANANPYRHVGGVVPPPKSERYAYPPAPTVIEQNAKERYANRFNNGQGGAPGSGFQGMGMGMGGGMGGMGPPYPPIAPALYPRPPPLVAQRPPMFGPPMMGMNPMMGMGMGMGGMGAMGMPMMGMGMPMGMSMPMATPIPGVVPGQPGMGYYNSMPGRFGRDMLGRDFAGPGGVGSSQPYRPPDPSALPPMPFGLPFIARPGQEGFDQYGRMLPPSLPEGWDGWGRPSVSTNPQLNVPGGAAGAGAPAAAPVAANAAGVPPDPTQTQTQQMPLSSGMYGSGSGSGPTSMSSTLSSRGTGRPDQPACFDRPPAKADSYFRYDQFEAFSLPCSSLNYPHQLHLPPELVSHDVNEEDWTRFIEDLTKEALQTARHPLHLHARGGRGTGPEPVFTEVIHSLLASWAVAFFSPRGIKIYAVSTMDGERILPAPIEPPMSKNGYRHAEEFSDEESDYDDYIPHHNHRYTGYSPSNSRDLYGFEDLSEEEEEREAQKRNMYLPRIERQYRKSEREIIKRREKRRNRREGELKLMNKRIGNWEIHFVCSTPTIWQKGARPRGYGEPVIRLTR
ncbi:uncharacterized protein I303_101752 [Kwoniella dejecticola CBS 10117]|uniref:Uncharacterized protein n=1 Tax=Kwoniella dejecticola CBS 10117 TaxID=1296121 RepID=A0AAJ8KIW8_9TREE